MNIYVEFDIINIGDGMMIKLVPAKCPNCGATLELDDNLKKTECKYCNTSIIVDDAIAKYKIEVSGEVKVDGIIGKNTLLDQAKKHMAIGELEAAEVILRQIISGHDRFDIEVYACLLQVLAREFAFNEEDQDMSELFMEDYVVKAFDETAGRYREDDDYENNNSLFNNLSEIKSIYERASKIDPEKRLDSLLGDDGDKIRHYVDIVARLEEDEKAILMVMKRIYKIEEDLGFKLAKDEFCQKNREKILEKVVEIIKRDLMLEDSFKYEITDWNSAKAFYNYGSCTLIQRDGSIIAWYLRSNKEYQPKAKYSIDKYFAAKVKPNSVDEEIKRVENLVNDLQELYDNPKKAISSGGIFSKMFSKK